MPHREHRLSRVQARHDQAPAGRARADPRPAREAQGRRRPRRARSGERSRSRGRRAHDGGGAGGRGAPVSAVRPCTVSLPIFEGPLDLLLHLIKRNEVQITDIPIATITDQYLAMLEDLPELNLDGAGEYLVMAATLTYIKRRRLLPPDADEEGEGEEDPRAELVQQLLEYQRYREAAADLGSRRLLDRDVFAAHGEPEPGADADDPRPRVRDASLADLLDALRGGLSRRPPPPWPP